MTDTLVAERPNTPGNLIEAYYLDDGEGISFFNVYLEFILFWIKTDAKSYRNASMMATTREEKELLMSMVFRKAVMFDIFSAHRTNGHKDWFESAFGDKTSDSEFVLENDFISLQGLKDIFHFAYRKEYESLAIFENVNHSDLESAIHILLESAAEHQRQHIMYLDSRVFDKAQMAEPAYHNFNTETAEKQWALISPSE